MTKIPTFRVEDKKPTSYLCTKHKTIVHSERAAY